MIQFFILISGLINTIFAIIILNKAKNKIQKFFSYLVFLIAFWAFWNVVYYEFPKYPFVNITYSIGAILVTCIFLWIASYSNYKLKKIQKFLLLLGTIVMFVVSLIPDKFITGEINSVSFGFNVETGPLFLIFSIPAVTIFLLVILMLIRERNKSDGLRKLQLNYVLLGFIIPIVIITIIDFILPVFFGMYDIASLDVTTSFIFVGFISYAILKYRFMDIGVVIKKSLLHFTSIVILFFIYFYLLFGFKDVLVENSGWSEQTALVLVILVIVLTIEPLRKSILKIIDKLFYSENKEIIKQTKNLELALNSTTQFDKLIDTIENSLQTYLTTTKVNFIWLNKQTGKFESYKDDENIVLESTGSVFQYLKSNPKVLVAEEIPYMLEEMTNGEKELLEKVEKKLKSLKVAMVLPIGETGELVGAFLFDKKQKNEAFTTENIEYLTELQPQMTGAIANAVFYKQAVDRITQV